VRQRPDTGLKWGWKSNASAGFYILVVLIGWDFAHPACRLPATTKKSLSIGAGHRHRRDSIVIDHPPQDRDNGDESNTASPDRSDAYFFFLNLGNRKKVYRGRPERRRKRNLFLVYSPLWGNGPQAATADHRKRKKDQQKEKKRQKGYASAKATMQRDHWMRLARLRPGIGSSRAAVI
jgi:hypothetical protein